MVSPTVRQARRDFGDQCGDEPCGAREAPTAYPYSSPLELPIGRMGGRKWNACPPRTASHNAGVAIDGIEPIVEVQLGGLAVSMRDIPCVFPVEGATGLLARCFAVQMILMPHVLPPANLTDGPMQGVVIRPAILTR